MYTDIKHTNKWFVMHITQSCYREQDWWWRNETSESSPRKLAVHKIERAPTFQNFLAGASARIIFVLRLVLLLVWVAVERMSLRGIVRSPLLPLACAKSVPVHLGMKGCANKYRVHYYRVEKLLLYCTRIYSLLAWKYISLKLIWRLYVWNYRSHLEFTYS